MPKGVPSCWQRFRGNPHRVRRRTDAYGSAWELARGDLCARLRMLEIDNFRLHQRAAEMAQELKQSQARERFLAGKLAAASEAVTTS